MAVIKTHSINLVNHVFEHYRMCISYAIIHLSLIRVRLCTTFRILYTFLGFSVFIPGVQYIKII